MLDSIEEMLKFLQQYGLNVNKHLLVDNRSLTPLGYILLKYYKLRKYNKIFDIINVEPGQVVIRKINGTSPFDHPDVKLYYEYLLKMWKPPLIDYSILMPCTSIKPYSRSTTHKMMKYYVQKLRNMGHSIEMYSISEPMLLVPEKYENLYPLANYDYPPKMMEEYEKDIMIERLSKVLPKLISSTKKLIVGILPTHHRTIVEESLRLLCQSDNRCYSRKIHIIPYGKLAFRSIKQVYIYIKNLEDNLILI